MIHRRAFLQSAAAGLAAAALPPAAAASPTRIIDAHTHFYDPTRPQGVPWPAPNETVLYKPTYPDRYLANVKPFHVDGTVAVEASPWLEDNLWLLNVADKNRLIKAIVGHIEPGHPDFKDALNRFSKHPLFRGIRIGAGSVPRVLARPEMLADLNQLSGKDLSLDILIDQPTWFADIARLAGRLPDLRIIVGHLPLDPPQDASGRAAYTESLRALGGHPRVYAKVSGVVRRINGRVPADVAFYRPGLDELWAVFGPDRVIYASNWPACDTTAPYSVVYPIVRDYLAGKGQDLNEKYFWKNSLAAYKWIER